jgi:hypothetical protein
MTKYLENSCQRAQQADAFDQTEADLIITSLQRELDMDMTCYQDVKADIDRLQAAIDMINMKTWR